MSSSKLPSALVWQGGSLSGHLTDEAIAALADDQDILPEGASAHVSACEECAHRVGEAAMLSVALGRPFGSALGEVLAEAPASAVPVSHKTAPLPIWALVFGLGFVGVGAVPFLMGMPGWLPRALLVLQRSVPVFLHGLVSVFAGMGRDALPRAMVSAAALAVLLMSGFAVSRLAPREGVAQ